jgi:murein DD-endopeptidase MepM/ murein hydrolase activator NlpD
MLFRLRNLIVVLAATGLIAACQSVEASAPTPTRDLTGTAAARSSWTPVPVAYLENSPIPTMTATATPTQATATPTTSSTPTATPVVTASPTLIPSATLLPTNTRRPTLTVVPTLAQTMISTNVPGPFGGDTATWTPLPPTRQIRDHYLFQRPIGSDHTDYWARNYSYGSTDNGTRPVHHGLDLLNELGTPALAAADGIVFYAGEDKMPLFGPQPDFYGNVIVIDHQFHDATGQAIYSLYGHLSEIEVKKGQKVKVGQEIGKVGSAGVATGSHLHFEIRAGNPTDYNSTRNPELWIFPYPTFGVLAGRVMNLDGTPVLGVLVEVRDPATYRSAYSYADNTVNSDPVIGENFVIPDLPAGYYTAFVRFPDGGLRFRTLTYVQPGKTNWIDIYLDTPEN